jgi:hypothetical protein
MLFLVFLLEKDKNPPVCVFVKDLTPCLLIWPMQCVFNLRESESNIPTAVKTASHQGCPSVHSIVKDGYPNM